MNQPGCHTAVPIMGLKLQCDIWLSRCQCAALIHSVFEAALSLDLDTLLLRTHFSLCLRMGPRWGSGWTWDNEKKKREVKTMKLLDQEHWKSHNSTQLYSLNRICYPLGLRWLFTFKAWKHETFIVQSSLFFKDSTLDTFISVSLWPSDQTVIR